MIEYGRSRSRETDRRRERDRDRDNRDRDRDRDRLRDRDRPASSRDHHVRDSPALLHTSRNPAPPPPAYSPPLRVSSLPMAKPLAVSAGPPLRIGSLPLPPNPSTSRAGPLSDPAASQSTGNGSGLPSRPVTLVPTGSGAMRGATPSTSTSTSATSANGRRTPLGPLPPATAVPTRPHSSPPPALNSRGGSSSLSGRLSGSLPGQAVGRRDGGWGDRASRASSVAATSITNARSPPRDESAGRELGPARGADRELEREERRRIERAERFGTGSASLASLRSTSARANGKTGDDSPRSTPGPVETGSASSTGFQIPYRSRKRTRDVQEDGSERGGSDWERELERGNGKERARDSPRDRDSARSERRDRERDRDRGGRRSRANSSEREKDRDSRGGGEQYFDRSAPSGRSGRDSKGCVLSSYPRLVQTRIAKGWGILTSGRGHRASRFPVDSAGSVTEPLPSLPLRFRRPTSPSTFSPPRLDAGPRGSSSHRAEPQFRPLAGEVDFAADMSFPSSTGSRDMSRPGSSQGGSKTPRARSPEVGATRMLESRGLEDRFASLPRRNDRQPKRNRTSRSRSPRERDRKNDAPRSRDASRSRSQTRSRSPVGARQRHRSEPRSRSTSPRPRAAPSGSRATPLGPPPRSSSSRSHSRSRTGSFSRPQSGSRSRANSESRSRPPSRAGNADDRSESSSGRRRRGGSQTPPLPATVASLSTSASYRSSSLTRPSLIANDVKVDRDQSTKDSTRFDGAKGEVKEELEEGEEPDPVPARHDDRWRRDDRREMSVDLERSRAVPYRDFAGRAFASTPTSRQPSRSPPPHVDSYRSRPLQAYRPIQHHVPPPVRTRSATPPIRPTSSALSRPAPNGTASRRSEDLEEGEEKEEGEIESSPPRPAPPIREQPLAPSPIRSRSRTRSPVLVARTGSPQSRRASETILSPVEPSFTPPRPPVELRDTSAKPASDPTVSRAEPVPPNAEPEEGEIVSEVDSVDIGPGAAGSATVPLKVAEVENANQVGSQLPDPERSSPVEKDLAPLPDGAPKNPCPGVSVEHAANASGQSSTSPPQATPLEDQPVDQPEQPEESKDPVLAGRPIDEHVEMDRPAMAEEEEVDAMRVDEASPDPTPPQAPSAAMELDSTTPPSPSTAAETVPLSAIGDRVSAPVTALDVRHSPAPVTAKDDEAEAAPPSSTTPLDHHSPPQPISPPQKHKDSPLDDPIAQEHDHRTKDAESIVPARPRPDHETWFQATWEDEADNQALLLPFLTQGFEERDQRRGEKMVELRKVYRTLDTDWQAHVKRLDRIKEHVQRKSSSTAAQTPSIDASGMPYFPEPITPGPSALSGGRGNRRGGGLTTSTWGYGDAVRSEAEFLEILASLENADLRDPDVRAARTAAVVPDMATDPADRAEVISCALDDERYRVDDPVEAYGIRAPMETWTEAEVETFCKRYAQHPKQFGKIAQGLPGKSTAQCVLFYYRMKNAIDFRSLSERRGRDGRRKKTKKRPGEGASGKGSSLLSNLKGAKKSAVDDRDDDDDDDATPTSPRNLKSSLHDEPTAPFQPRPSATPRGLPLNRDDDYTPSVSRLPRSRLGGPHPASEGMLEAAEALGALMGTHGEDGDDRTPQTLRPRAAKSNRKVRMDLDDDGAIETPSSEKAKPKRKTNTNSYWSANEKVEIVRLLEIHGKNWKAIAEELENKTAVQCKNWFTNNSRKLGLRAGGNTAADADEDESSAMTPSDYSPAIANPRSSGLARTEYFPTTEASALPPLPAIPTTPSLTAAAGMHLRNMLNESVPDEDASNSAREDWFGAGPDDAAGVSTEDETMSHQASSALRVSQAPSSAAPVASTARPPHARAHLDVPNGHYGPPRAATIADRRFDPFSTRSAPPTTTATGTASQWSPAPVSPFHSFGSVAPATPGPSSAPSADYYRRPTPADYFSVKTATFPSGTHDQHHRFAVPPAHASPILSTPPAHSHRITSQLPPPRPPAPAPGPAPASWLTEPRR